MHPSELPADILHDMESKQIDIDLTVRILNNCNQGKYRNVEPVHVQSIPKIDGRTILDIEGLSRFAVQAEAAVERIRAVDTSIVLEQIGSRSGGSLQFDRKGLQTLGLLLFPYVAYGVLNGGSATSYADSRKNSSFNPELHSLLQKEFECMAELTSGRPKGVTPAFLNPDGTPGQSFLLLKMRSLLKTAYEYTKLTGRPVPAENLFFQMTSVHTDDEIREAYTGYESDPLLADLIRETGVRITKPETGIQKLIAAYTHSSEGTPRRIFSHAYGEDGKTLPLPGGHGQNFTVLQDVYRRLYNSGKRFAYLGNVDNVGYTIDPVEIAILALSGKQAGFDFSFRTPVDVKGGVLVVDQRGRLNAADIGPAISEKDIAEAESTGNTVMFNCATGLFNLEYLTSNLESISENLPMRWSDQDKDAGKYSQAEQVTWEVVGMLDDFLVFGIDKYKRFLAAKLLMETLMTSGTGLDNPLYPIRGTVQTMARELHRGLVGKLRTDYGMHLENGVWKPLRLRELNPAVRG